METGHLETPAVRAAGWEWEAQISRRQNHCMFSGEVRVMSSRVGCCGSPQYWVLSEVPGRLLRNEISGFKSRCECQNYWGMSWERMKRGEREIEKE